MQLKTKYSRGFIKRYNSGSGGWYDENIEEPVKELVCLLRNNGFNTEDSCGHEMYVQCQYIPNDDLMRLHTLIFDYLHERKLPINFDINVSIKVRDGHQYPSLEINLNYDRTL